MGKENAIRTSKLLLVEGNHERDVFKVWLRTLNKKDVQVMPIAGKTRLRENLRSLAKQSAFPSVGSLVVVRDADDDPGAAFQSVRDALVSVGLPGPPHAWTFTHAAGLRVGIVILPGADRPGALEELLLAAVVEDPMAAPAHHFIADAVMTLTRIGYRPPPPPHRRGKAEIHAFLATFEDPDKDPGKAALAGAWPFHHESLKPMQTILENL